MRRHTGEKPFTCKECDKKFADKSDLKKHLNVHTGEKNFTCKVCNKSVKSLNSWKIHSRIHTGNKIIKTNRFENSES